MLVADALRLGGAILSTFPDMLAPQLIGRLLPEIGPNPNVKSLLSECDASGSKDCALIPFYHCLHTPGGPLKYSLEGHQFAVFDFCLTTDYRYIVSISNKFIMWDVSTSDMTRDVNPGLEGIMQQLCLSPDNRYAAAYTNYNETVLLNCLTSEYIVIPNSLENKENVVGVFLLNTYIFIYGQSSWCRFDFRGNLQEMCNNNEEPMWPILYMNFQTIDTYWILFWSGNLDDSKLKLKSVFEGEECESLFFFSCLAMSENNLHLYCCTKQNSYKVAEYEYDKKSKKWACTKNLPLPEISSKDDLLQLKLNKTEDCLLGTLANGFMVWILSAEKNVTTLKLPHGIRNITARMTKSNSCMLSQNREYVVAGVRRNLYIWNLQNAELVKVLDAHFGRIISLEPLTIGNWNSVITSSIDRSVKVWNINNIFEQVHSIDRHELQIDSVSISQSAGIAITVTRGCVGVWDILVGRLISQLADSPLGAIVTHALITPDGKYIICSESGNILIWNRLTEQVVYREAQQNVAQLTFLDDGAKFFAISKPQSTGGDITARVTATCTTRLIPSGKYIYSFEFTIRNIPGVSFKEAVVTSDNANIVVLAADKGHREAMFVFSCKTGEMNSKVPLKYSAVKDVIFLVAIPNRPNQVAMIDPDRAVLVDIRGKKISRSIPKWGGMCTKDGRYGLCAPARGGLELIELKKGTTVRTFIPKVAEGVFSVICMFNKTDEYVLYYHSGKKTIRVFRRTDAEMVANYRVQTELSAIESTEDGRAIVLGTVDGCLSVLAIADPAKEDMKEFLASLPSRDEEWKKKQEKKRMSQRFRAAATAAKLCVKMSSENVSFDNLSSKQLEEIH